MEILTNQSAIEYADLAAGHGQGPTLRSLPGPVHVLREYGRRARDTGDLITHATRSLPSHDDLVPCGRSIASVSPEMALACMASGKCLPLVIAMLDEACGTYRTPRLAAVPSYAYAYPYGHAHFLPKGSDALTCKRASFYGLAPVTSVSRIAGFIDAHPGHHGVDRLRRALPYCEDGMRSYLETQFFTYTFLPARHGGCALPRPRTNHRIDLPGSLREVAGKPYILADNAWVERRVAVELLGARDHAGDGITDTSVREKLYRELGWTCVTITWGEVNDPKKYSMAVRVLARELGHRIRADCTNFALRQRWLFDELRFRQGDPPNRSSYKVLAEALDRGYDPDWLTG